MSSGLFTLFLALSAYAAFILAYFIYGRFLSRRLFNFVGEEPMPSHALQDGRDYVPSRRAVLFGHHFTSIAGAGPIVGPAIAVVWGWLPAILWVVFGAIFMGAVHDFCALAISARNQGRSLVDISREVMNPRVRIIFFLFIFFTLVLVMAVFLFVMAKLFITFPASVFPIWMQIPIAVGLGVMVRKGANLYVWGLAALALVVGCVWVGVNHFIWDLTGLFPKENLNLTSPYFVWVIILLVYAFIASVLPVHWLLQPRDFLNSLWLYLGVGGVLLGFIIAPQALADPTPIRTNVEGLPPMFPLLFITIACGAVSGFHCLVCSGTTSKQLNSAEDALPISYGAMLLEGALAVLVIVACCSGISKEVWASSEGYGSWSGAQGKAVLRFVEGTAAYLSNLGIPVEYGLTVMAVILVSFCGTTLDTATRIQRYVISELASSLNLKLVARPMVATTIACVSALALSVFRDPSTQAMGGGGYVLWPLFGNINQMLACLALLVGTVYLAKRGWPVVYTLIPCVFLLITAGYAIFLQTKGFLYGAQPNYVLFSVSVAVTVLEVWMLLEGLVVLVQSLSAPRPQTEPAG